jgi:diguanylate cyclase (GGDEF)-like protein/PAS domain S-box-containing protein
LKLPEDVTDSIDIYGLFSADVTSTGSFDLHGVERTALGKLLRALPMLVLLVDESHKVIFSNGSTEAVQDFSDPLLGRPFLDLFPQSRHATLALSLIKKALLHRKPQVMEAVVHLHDRKLWGRLHLRTLRMGPSRLLFVLIEDLTLEKKQMLLDRKHQDELRKARDELELRVRERTAELTRTNEQMRLEIAERRRAEAGLSLAGRIIDWSNEAILVIDPEGSIVKVNHAFSKITGYSPDEVLNELYTRFHQGPDAQNSGQEMWQSLRERGEWQGEVWDKRKTGELYPKLLSMSAVRDSNNEVTHYVGIFSDITRLKETERRLIRLAHYDSLTGLPNRILFRKRLHEALIGSGAKGKSVAVMLLDLDRFKNINETMGHRFGDKVLRAVANTLTACLVGHDTAGRLGGDEFAVVLPEVSGAAEVAKVARGIQGALSVPMVIDRREVFITASLGVALYPSDGDKVDVLLQNADTALHFAKERGKNRCRLFSRDMNSEISRRQRLEHLIRVALMRAQFVLHYQPVIDIGSMKIVSAEALLRWRHPRHGPLSAERLIPVAEETGLIIPVGEWVLRTACHQNREWQRMGLQPIRISVNFSGRQLKEQNIAYTVQRILKEADLDPSFLEIELTESIMLDDPEATQKTLLDLKKQGVGIAIDDFGTGYSSLNYLRSLPANKLKIDKCFLKGVSSDPQEQALVRAILTVAHSRELVVVAEGVETFEQFDFLRVNHCDQMQGYYVKPPIEADLFTNLLRKGPVVKP